MRAKGGGELIISPPPPPSCLFSVKARGKNGKITHGGRLLLRERAHLLAGLQKNCVFPSARAKIIFFLFGWIVEELVGFFHRVVSFDNKNRLRLVAIK